MIKPLKDQNLTRLLAVITANVVVFVVFSHNGPITDPSLYTQAGKLLGQLVPAVLAAAFLSILNGLIGPHTKAQLVFWRWSDPLPGSRAFSVHAGTDPRVNVARLKSKLDKWPRNPREQNSMWYGLYRTVQSEPAVTTGHREFLFARDYASLSLLFLVFLGALAIYLFPDRLRAEVYVAILAAQYLIVRYVAAQYGTRFVTTVLALKSAEQ